jgi:hypothetical protein
MVLAFSRLFKMNGYIDYFKDDFFMDSLTEHFLIVAKLSLKHKITTAIVFNIITNKLSKVQLLKEFEKIVGIMVSGYLEYKDDNKISLMFSEILNEY